MTRKGGQSYPWYRMYTEARTDTKLRALTKPQHYVWFNLLCLSADQDARGVITGYESELLAVEVADGDETLLAETIERLVKFRILEVVDGGWRFINFMERQYDKPSDTPEETSARKRESRANTTASRDVTPGHAVSRPGHAVSRIESDRESDTDPETELTDRHTHARAREASDAAAAVVAPRGAGATGAANTPSAGDPAVIALSERIAASTHLPQRPDVLEHLTGVLTTHLARGVSPDAIEREVLNLIDPSTKKPNPRPTIKTINNWLSHVEPVTHTEREDREDNSHERSERHTANGRRPLAAVAGGRRVALVPDPNDNGPYAHLFTVASDDDPDEE